MNPIRVSRIRLRSDVHLFAEEPSRIIVTFRRENWQELRQLAGSMEAGLYLLGTTGGDSYQGDDTPSHDHRYCIPRANCDGSCQHTSANL